MLGSAKANAEIGAAAGFDTLSKPISRPTQAESSRTSRSRSKREKCGLRACNEIIATKCAGSLVSTKADFSDDSGLSELRANAGDGRKDQQIVR